MRGENKSNQQLFILIVLNWLIINGGGRNFSINKTKYLINNFLSCKRNLRSKNVSKNLQQNKFNKINKLKYQTPKFVYI